MGSAPRYSVGHIKKLCEGFKKLKGSLKEKTDAKNSEEAHNILDISDSMGRVDEVKRQRKHNKKPRGGAFDNKSGNQYSPALALRELSVIYRSSMLRITKLPGFFYFNLNLN